MDSDTMKVIALYQDEFKYRHENYWRLFFKFTYAIVFLLAIPYVYPKATSSLQVYLWGLPLLALCLTLCGSWMLAAEYERLRLVRAKYVQLLSQKPEHAPLPINDDIKGTILGFSIGKMSTILFLVVLVPLSIVGIWLAL